MSLPVYPRRRSLVVWFLIMVGLYIGISLIIHGRILEN